MKLASTSGLSTMTVASDPIVRCTGANAAGGSGAVGGDARIRVRAAVARDAPWKSRSIDAASRIGLDDIPAKTGASTAALARQSAGGTTTIERVRPGLSK